MIDIKRRAAFTEAFNLYPSILMEIVKSNDIYIIDQMDPPNEVEFIIDEDAQRKIALLLMAQFMTRLIVTRCNAAAPPLELFGAEAADRYGVMYRDTLGAGRELALNERKKAALDVFEQGMSGIVFEALATEAKIIEDAAAEGNAAPDENWDEADFWLDVFLSFSGNQRRDQPRWVLAAQEVFTNHRADFTAACRVPS